MTSAYFDTADRDLQAHNLLLRRREGDDDAGWQLKAPDANGRIEIRYPLSDTMPPELSALLTGVRLGKQLVNVATARRPVTPAHPANVSNVVRWPIARKAADQRTDSAVHGYPWTSQWHQIPNGVRR